MKLFRKTLFFFIGVIAFQSVLTILLIINITRSTNLADARRELEDEAAILYDGFNSWKRQIWISLIGIMDGRGPVRSDAAGRVRFIKELLLTTKMDAIAVKDPGGLFFDMVQAPNGAFTMSDLGRLSNAMPHPYIELARAGGALCMVGVTRIGGGTARGYDVFCVKRVDDYFCSQLTLNRRSLVAVFEGNHVAAGSLSADMRPSFFDSASLKSAYLETYDRRMGRESYNVAFQRIGRLDHLSEGGDLFLATFLSNAVYDERILQVSRAVLLVSVAGALLTIFLSLFLSRNITHPIADLLAGMERIRDGEWDTRVRSRGGYEIGRLFGGFNDMARELDQNRTAMREALHETVLLKEYNEKIINSIRAGIAIVNRALEVEKANKSFLDCFGLEGTRVIGAPFATLGIDIVDDSILSMIRSILDRERDSFSEVKRSRSGRVFEIRLYPFYSAEGEFHEASGCVFMADDISAKTELEEKIFQAEKLSSISMLSAGMAHEINNPLGSILTNVQNLIGEEADPERKISLKWIEQETRRIARIVQELLNFASTDAGRAPEADVNGVVEEVIRLVSRSIPREGGIRIAAHLASGLPAAAVGTDELKQVVVNLLKNSIQAIRDSGRILVSTRLSRKGDRISLSVSDTGQGIPPEIIPRIFDPFFTTKADAGGTGLGLSVVYGIVSKHNGTIDVKSGEGRGTRISLNLPLPGGRS